MQFVRPLIDVRQRAEQWNLVHVTCIFFLDCIDFAVSGIEVESLLGGSRVDDRSHLRDSIGRKTALSGMFAHHLLVRRVIDAINFIVRDVTVHPLNLRSQFLQHAARLLRNRL